MTEYEDIKKSLIEKQLDDEWDIVVKMRPDQFLRLTKGGACLSDCNDFDPERMKDWSEWPYLMLDTDTKQIHGHEGRHRVEAMRRCGITEIDIHIMITPDATRYGTDDRALARMLAWTPTQTPGEPDQWRSQQTIFELTTGQISHAH